MSVLVKTTWWRTTSVLITVRQHVKGFDVLLRNRERCESSDSIFVVQLEPHQTCCVGEQKSDMFR